MCKLRKIERRAHAKSRQPSNKLFDLRRIFFQSQNALSLSLSSSFSLSSCRKNSPISGIFGRFENFDPFLRSSSKRIVAREGGHRCAEYFVNFLPRLTCLSRSHLVRSPCLRLLTREGSTDAPCHRIVPISTAPMAFCQTSSSFFCLDERSTRWLDDVRTNDVSRQTSKLPREIVNFSSRRVYLLASLLSAVL